MKYLLQTGLIAMAVAFSAPASAEPPAKWTQYCKKCHGDDGKGATKMGEKLKVTDMTTAEWHSKRKDPEIKKSIRDGNAKVKQPAYAADKISDAELDELVKFIRSLKK